MCPPGSNSATRNPSRAAADRRHHSACRAAVHDQIIDLLRVQGRKRVYKDEARSDQHGHSFAR